MATSSDRPDLSRHVSLPKQRNDVQVKDDTEVSVFVDQHLLNQHFDNLSLCFELLTPFLICLGNGV